MATRSKIFIGILLVLLSLIHLQQYANRPILKDLKGAFQRLELPRWSTEQWFSGKWQSDFEAYQNQNFGYREGFTRVHNQIHYSLFQQVYHDDIRLGKEGDLIGGEYLEAFTGKRYVGDSLIDLRSQALKRLNDLTRDSNKLFMVVLAPDKAFSKPQEFDLPEESIKPNNYEAWLRHLNRDSIHYLDFRSHFAEIQAESPYPLFTKTGIHWSVWGMRYAMDSIAGYIAKNSSLSMPRMQVLRNDWSTEYKPIERDLELALNLAYPMKKDSVAYQFFQMQNDSTKPKVLVISDSFFYEMYSSGLANKFFDAPFFWYYNNRALKYDWLEAPRNTQHYDIDSLIADTDVILLMSAASNLRDFPWAFENRIPQ